MYGVGIRDRPPDGQEVRMVQIIGIMPLFQNLQLFGEGGDGGAGAAPGGPAGAGEAGTGVQAPDAGEQAPKAKSRKREPLPYVYGKAADAGTPSPAVSSAAPQPEEKPADKPPESWEDVKKRYKEEYGKDVQSAIQGRLKNMDALKDRAARMEALLTRMGSLDYDGIVGEDGTLDLDKLEKAVDDDDKYYEKKAEERGWSTETEKYVSHLERKDAARQAEEAARQKDILQRQQFEQRMAQAEEARTNYPGLDFFAEMNDRTFASLMANPMITVQQAYELVHRDEILAAREARIQQATREGMAASIQAGANRPAENGLGGASAANVTRITDPRQLTREQRKDLKNRVRHGERFEW